MKRKITILPTAVVAALSSASLLAQVYNLPSAGYYLFDMPQGYSMQTTPLLVYDPTNKDYNEVADILGNAATNGDTVFTMDGNGFKANNYLNGWTDAEMLLPPGTAWFFKNAYPQNLNWVGGFIPDGTNQLPAGFSACGSIIPVTDRLTGQLLKFPIANGDRVFIFNNTNNTYSVDTFTNNNWEPDEPIVSFGQSFWVSKGTGSNWIEDLDADPIGVDSSLAQPELGSVTGQLNFFTFNAAVSAFGQVMDTSGLPLSTNGLGQLYAGTNASEGAFVPVGAAVSFSGNAPGYISSGTVSIPFVTGGKTVYVQLRAWRRSAGGTFEEASARGAPIGVSDTMMLTAHATIEGNQPGIPPPDVNGFLSFQLAFFSPPPRVPVQSPALSGANLGFSFASVSTEYYVVWICTDLGTMNWMPWTYLAGTGSSVQVSVPVRNGASQQFFWVQGVRLPK